MSPSLSDTSKKNIQNAYTAWGVPEKLAACAGDTSFEWLSEVLRAVEKRIPDMQCRIVPTSFDADDPALLGFPRPVDAGWQSCERMFRMVQSRGVMMRLPAYWQIGFPLHAACRAVGIPLFTNEPENIPVGAMALKAGGMDTVVTESRDAAAFAEYLIEKERPNPLLGVLIHRISDTWDVPHAVLDAWQHVLQEVHLFPGVPILEQCFVLAQKKAAYFHLSDSYHWDVSAQKTVITSCGNDPLPLFRYELPFILKKSGDCLCGKPVYERHV